ncbi:hypothetical protein O3P69_011635 [Scylla paramamosain]|uniref:Uncharacterized protein n=2 Tax=Scylla paramamosain TaxID=85552 RepID=A0AAW0T8V1_SCYPA
MQRGLCVSMKLCMLVVLLLEIHLGIINDNKVSAVSSDNEEEVDLEWEVFGTANDRHYGVNILDKKGEVIISNPTDWVLRAVVHPNDYPASMALHKVKAMYQRLLNGESSQAGDNIPYVEAEIKAAEEQNNKRDQSVFANLLKWMWGEA